MYHYGEIVSLVSCRALQGARCLFWGNY